MKICYLGFNGHLHLERWMNAFVKMGHDVHYIAAYPELDSGPYQCKGVTVHPVDTSLKGLRQLPGTRKIIRVLLPPENVIKQQVRKIVERLKPDILHAHYIFPFGVTAMETAYHPFVMTCWGSDIYCIRDEERVEIAKKVLRSADLVTGDSKDLVLSIQEMGVSPERCLEVIWGVDTEEFAPGNNGHLHKELGLGANKVVLSTRRLRSLYNIDILIEAIPQVIKEIPAARFLIASHGEQQEALEVQAKTIGIERYVRFLGKVDYETLKSCYQSASIYVTIPSSDATSVSLLEAMSSSLPVIVTDLPSNREWVEDGVNGYIVPIRNPQILAERIIQLLKSPDVLKDFARKNREIIIKRADHYQQMKKMEEALFRFIKE